MSQVSVPSIAKVGRHRRGAAAVKADQLATFQPLLPGQAIPLLCQPAVSGVNLVEWMRENRAALEQKLLTHGALLFRGFDVNGIEEFNACVDAMSGGALEYLFRASPRTQIARQFNVYSSTDYPASEKIFPHNEHSYSPKFPQHLYFYAEQPSPEGGETPLGGTREVMSRIDPDVRDELIARKVMYVRNYGDGMGLPWQTVFQTEDRAEVDAYCRGIGIKTEWKDGDRLRTRQIGPAVVRHPVSGETVWFNHATFFNALTLPEVLREGLLQEFAPEDLPQNTFFGDGTEIQPATIAHLQKAYRDAMVEFPWEQGDLVLLDNILAVHARNEYAGSRRILTAMAIAVTAGDVAVSGEAGS